MSNPDLNSMATLLLPSPEAMTTSMLAAAASLTDGPSPIMFTATLPPPHLRWASLQPYENNAN